MNIPASLRTYEGEVLPEWLDANDHMNLAYYTVLFDYATDVLFDVIGNWPPVQRQHQQGTFVVETHNSYERELLVGDRVRVSTQILAMDANRLHLAHEMFMIASGRRAATQELMFLHVDLSARRVEPFPHEVRERVAASGGGARRSSPGRTGSGAGSLCRHEGQACSAASARPEGGAGVLARPFAPARPRPSPIARARARGSSCSASTRIVNKVGGPIGPIGLLELARRGSSVP